MYDETHSDIGFPAIVRRRFRMLDLDDEFNGPEHDEADSSVWLERFGMRTDRIDVYSVGRDETDLDIKRGTEDGDVESLGGAGRSLLAVTRI